MKTLILSVLLMCAVQGIMAQEKVMVITPVKKGEEPSQVMEALKADFPTAVTKELAFLPSKLYGDEWNVAVTGDNISDVNFYQVTLVQGKNEYVAVYDKDGKLISSKQVMHDAVLPSPVRASINKFKGWHVDKVHEILTYRDNKLTDTYRVKLQKGAEHKTVFLDSHGEIINTRFVLF